MCERVRPRRILAGFNGTDPNVSGMLGQALSIPEILEGPLKGSAANTVRVSCQGKQLGSAAQCFSTAGGVLTKTSGGD